MGGGKFVRGRYHSHPIMPLKTGSFLEAEATGRALVSTASGGVPLIDGFLGVDGEAVKTRLLSMVEFRGWQLFDMREEFDSVQDVHARMDACVGNDDPVFGILYSGTLADLFWQEALASLLACVARGRMILSGPGAAIVDDRRRVVYCEFSKENSQTRPSAPVNLGLRVPDGKRLYKRTCVVDWPVLGRHRTSIRDRTGLWIDTNQPGYWRALSGDDRRAAISELARHPFRVKPWFLPGPWEGQFMKRHFGLASSHPNFAWPYELIKPENGLLVGNDSRALEVPFPFTIAQDPAAYVGDHVTRRLGCNSPIRCDSLDTIDGGNPSLRCLPSEGFVCSKFGETFAHDETYSIHDCEDDARVYLCFREDADQAKFWRTARISCEQHRTFEVEDFIGAWPVHKGDICLVPNGAIHCSGRGNPVLELSATPYIFTFKICDYLRRNLRREFRPLHIDYAEHNARPERTAPWVRNNLIPQPRLKTTGPDWAVYEVCNSPKLFYVVDRVGFSSRFTQASVAGVEVVNLVEGNQIETVGHEGRLDLDHRETAVIPAAA